jgi:hypothetical protein
MTFDEPALQAFLVRAKQATYAASGDAEMLARASQPSSRPASHDLAYREAPYAYLDSYLGGFAFIGEEAVWQNEQPLWGMNYYGSMTIANVPQGFSRFLKRALLHLSADAPFRGPPSFAEGDFTYTCRWAGSLRRFQGEETITLVGQTIYTLWFHGGIVE